MLWLYMTGCTVSDESTESNYISTNVIYFQYINRAETYHKIMHLVIIFLFITVIDLKLAVVNGHLQINVVLSNGM